MIFSYFLLAIKVQITGKGKCKWMEILRKNSQYSNETPRSLFYSSKEIYCHCENSLMVFEPRGMELNAGEHKFEFIVPLKWTLPSTFKGSHGSIKYKLRILIQKPWTFDERYKIPIIIIKNFVLPPYGINFIHPLKKGITKKVSIFGSQPITLVAELPKGFGICGRPLSICASVINNSTTNVEKLRFSILQHIIYYSDLRVKEKKETISIVTKETGSVQKKTQRLFSHELLLPATAQPTDNENSHIIHISYELRVEAVLRGLFKNIVVNVPFTLYSADRNNLNTSNYRASIASSVLGLPVYPSLDSSIGSPSRSSQFSEAGSLCSSTSNSSATTLSPATAGASEISNRSTDSSNFINDAGDIPSDVESSRGRLMGTELGFDYISTLIPDSVSLTSSDNISELILAGDLPSDVESLRGIESDAALPSFTSASRNNLPSSSAVFLNRREPSGVDDLPPSYEELFGTAPIL